MTVEVILALIVLVVVGVYSYLLIFFTKDKP